MHGLSAIDGGIKIDWSKTSNDYATYRPGPPQGFFERLRVLGVGLRGQKILDLGTGTGILAREFASQGAQVCGIDVAEGQIAQARLLAQRADLQAEFKVAGAENTGYPNASFDCITANQCWLYFDKAKVVPEVKRLLKAPGSLVTSHFSWLPKLDPTAAKTEELILKYNPNWTAGGWEGVIPPMPTWAEGQFRLKAMFYYDEPVPFTRESWRGRIRASRGVGAALSADLVSKFDEDHARLLERIVPEHFTILHRIDAHIFEPI